jgi:hypothetical protein
MHTKIVLYYDPPQAGRPLPLAVIRDPRVIERAARSVIESRRGEAKRLSAIDQTLGAEAQAEAEKLNKLLMMLVPALARTSETTA